MGNFFLELKRRHVYKVAVGPCRRRLAFDSGRNAGFSVLGNYELGCSSGLRDDSPYKNLFARVDLPTAS